MYKKIIEDDFIEIPPLGKFSFPKPIVIGSGEHCLCLSPSLDTIDDPEVTVVDFMLGSEYFRPNYQGYLELHLKNNVIDIEKSLDSISLNIPREEKNPWIKPMLTVWLKRLSENPF